MAASRKRATTPEAREQQLIVKAFDLAEKRLNNGTATAAEITYLLKRGSSMARLEEEKARKEVIMLQRRAEVLESQKNTEELYAQALTAMRVYQGVEETVDDEDL